MKQQQDLEAISKRLGIKKMKNQDLLKEALTHRSYLNENRGQNLNQNERLEFLGDAVLELVVTEFLFKNYPNPEGELTNWRAALVNGEMLFKVSQELDLENHLLMSKGERKDTGKSRHYILANSVEAIIGAVYLDQGYEMAKKIIDKYFLSKLDEVLETKSYLDAKSYFQEKAQEIEQVTPHYEVEKEWGPDHDKTFRVAVYLDKKKVAEGEGDSKQVAQRNAAKKGLEVKEWE